MTRRTLTVLPFFLTLCCAIGYAQDAADPAMQDEAQEAEAAGDPGDVLTPLAIGNTWVFENTVDGVTSTERVVGVVEYDGRPWYLLRSEERAIDAPQDADPDYVTEIWLSHHEGIEYDAQAKIDEETGRLEMTRVSAYFRYPAAEGQVYKPSRDDPGLKVEVVGVDVPVKNRAGEFACVAYRETHTEEPGYSFTSYVAPGVGIVRYATTFEGETSTADLIAYTLVDEKEE